MLLENSRLSAVLRGWAGGGPHLGQVAQSRGITARIRPGVNEVINRIDFPSSREM